MSKERPRPSKIIASVNSLLEARRLLRIVKNSTDFNKREVDKIKRQLQNCRSNKARSANLQFCHSISQDARQNLKTGSHILTALNTHLSEDSNLSLKLKSQTNEAIEQNEKILEEAGAMLSEMTTKFDSPLNVIAADLQKKFKSIAQTQIQLVQEGDVYVVMTIATKYAVYVVIEEGDPGFYFKTYTEWPSEPSETGRTQFVSPSQAFKLICDILRKDGLLEE